jgi:hypothetical protein
LLSFVNSLYNPDGTPVSSFATFRVNLDKDLSVGSSPIRGYFMALADHGTESFRPLLNVEVVPELTSLILLGIGVSVGPVRSLVKMRKMGKEICFLL